MWFLNLYQYLAPLVLFPVSYWLWWHRCEHSHACVLLLLSMPVLFAYVIPGLGTNWLGLWEFNTRWRLGKFRPHHGFVFGTATSLFALLCLEPRSASLGIWELVRSGFLLGSVLAFWNWLYDIYAIKAGFIVVYNRPYALRLGPEAIATDYAPVVFGAFGVCYGIAVRIAEYWLLDRGEWQLYGWLVVIGNLAVLIVPVLAFVLSSYWRHAVAGLRPRKGG
jgi:hypothetical protein